MTSSSSFRRRSRYEERKEVVNDVGRGDARDICVIVGRCDFDDVCTADYEWKRKRALVREKCRVLNCETLNVHKVKACEAADDALDLAGRPTAHFGSPSYKKKE